MKEKSNPVWYFINADTGADTHAGNSLKCPIRSLKEAVARANLLPKGQPVVLVLASNVRDPIAPFLVELIASRPTRIMSELVYLEKKSQEES